MLLGDDVNQKVQVYLWKVREGGSTISMRIAVAAARGILLKSNRSLFAEFGGPINISHSTLGTFSAEENNFVQTKAKTSKSKFT